MIVVKLIDDTNYAACDEIEFINAEGEEGVEPSEFNLDGLTMVMRRVKVRKGMKAHIIDGKEDEENERDLIVHHPRQTLRVDGARITHRRRDSTTFSIRGYEVVA